MSVDQFVDVVPVRETDVDRLEQAWSFLVRLQDGASEQGPLGQALEVVMPLLYRELVTAHAFFDGGHRHGPLVAFQEAAAAADTAIGIEREEGR